MKRYAILDERVREGELQFLTHCQGFFSKNLDAIKQEFADEREGIIEDGDEDYLKHFDKYVKIVQLKIKEI